MKPGTADATRTVYELRLARALEEISQLHGEIDKLVTALRDAEKLRPALLRQLQYVPESVLEYCNNARSLLRELGEDA